METRHIVPVDDIVDHNTYSDECICGPDFEWVEGTKMVLHHSLDGREHFEEGHDKENCPLCSSNL